MKKALITGITGQDGSYLAELLLKKNYEIHGIIRRTSTFNTDRHVGISFKESVYTSLVDGIGVLKLLEIIRKVNKDIKFYQASTSEMFGTKQAKKCLGWEPKVKFKQLVYNMMEEELKSL